MSVISAFTFHFVLLFCLVLNGSFHLAFGGSTRGDETDAIIRDIMNNYQKDVHPNSDRDDGAVDVLIGVTPLFLEFEEDSSIMSTHFWLAMSWKDQRLSWSMSQRKNVSRVYIAPDQLWKPDMRVFNSVHHEDYEATDVVVFSDGTLFWIPPVTTYTSCDMDFTYWPWDIQTCAIAIGSWVKSGYELDVHNLNRQNDTQVYLDNYGGTLWEVVSARARRTVNYYPNVDSPWPDVTVKFVLRRKSFVDRKLAVLPLILVSCLTLATFWTHPSSSYRIALGGLNLAILIIMLITLRSRLPMAGAQLPYVVSFTGSLAVLVTIQVLVALSLANLVARKDAPPSMLIWPLQGTVGTALCLSDTPLIGQIPGMVGYSIDVEALRKQQDNSTPSAPPAEPKPEFTGWNLLCQAIDRVMFVLYLAIIFIFIGSYLVGAAVKDSKSG